MPSDTVVLTQLAGSSRLGLSNSPYITTADSGVHKDRSLNSDLGSQIS